MKVYLLLPRFNLRGLFVVLFCLHPIVLRRMGCLRCASEGVASMHHRSAL